MDNRFQLTQQATKFFLCDCWPICYSRDTKALSSLHYTRLFKAISCCLCVWYKLYWIIIVVNSSKMSGAKQKRAVVTTTKNFERKPPHSAPPNQPLISTNSRGIVKITRTVVTQYYKSYSYWSIFFTGVGGAFLITGSKVKQHVMPDFSSTPLETDEKIDSWLRFYNMSPPLVAVGTFVTNDPVSLIFKYLHFCLSLGRLCFLYLKINSA